MYGTRAAAQDWQHAVNQSLVGLRFVAGVSSANILSHPGRAIWTFVHGDDFVSSAHPKDLKWMDVELTTAFSCKTQILGPDPEHMKEVRVSDRLLTWDSRFGVIYEADPTHAANIIR